MLFVYLMCSIGRSFDDNSPWRLYQSWAIHTFLSTAVAGIISWGWVVVAISHLSLQCFLLKLVHVSITRAVLLKPRTGRASVLVVTHFVCFVGIVVASSVASICSVFRCRFGIYFRCGCLHFCGAFSFGFCSEPGTWVAKCPSRTQISYSCYVSSYVQSFSVTF
ncbi:uncharacterized protein LY89DRAFT_67316 [Mollisia scopiformis]|uniref:Uncharacterized protein n=1 Tax=Mollisia scopiformis TaxID=149040 RepID=A0A194X9R7_MOLSC|nr:uncharacterized protein LY89DRAFT_67316 [Mollisia scopiformis]KUJ16911.1 hypothetical protein LY89DRAFT_67316 [Mollisia scopiformis]